MLCRIIGICLTDFGKFGCTARIKKTEVLTKIIIVMKWFLKCFKQYADFSGRARRKEYWYFVLINFIICLALIIPWVVTSVKAALSYPSIDVMEFYLIMLSSPWLWLYIIYSLVVLVPSLAVMVRRLHDIGRSGWWLLFMYLGTVIVNVAGVFEDLLGLWLIVFFLLALAICIISLVWMCTDSQVGSNKWGENPKEESSAEEV